MADNQSYERVLKKKRGVSIALMICLYAFILVIWLSILPSIGLKPPVIMMIPLSIFIVFLLTWRYTKVEYEYSLMGGTLTFAKIYGSRSRRTLFEVDIKDILEIRPAVEGDYKGGRDNAKVIMGIPDKKGENPCVCIFEDNKENKIFFILDCDLRSAKIFKSVNPTATSRNIFNALESDKDE